MFAARVFTMQIIAAALLLGVLGLSGVSVALSPVAARNADDMPIVSYMALLMLATNVPMSFFVPNAMLRAAVQRIAASPAAESTTPDGVSRVESVLLAVRQTTLIVALALLEGTAFLGAIAFLLEGQAWVWVVVIVTVGLMAFNFPTQGSVRDWLDRHRRIVDELRQLGGLR